MQIKEPIDVDSMDKMNRWLAECGLPQRKASNEERIKWPTRAMILSEFTSVPDDPEFVGTFTSFVVKKLADRLFFILSRIGKGKQIIWVTPPELNVAKEFFLTTPHGEWLDPLTYKASPDTAAEIDSGIAQYNRFCSIGIYARLWLEDAT